MISKPELRKEMLAKRRALDEKARARAENQLKQNFSKTSGLTLSYASFGSELSTAALNYELAQLGSLVLPRRDGHALRFFRVAHAPPHTDALWEPELGEEVVLEAICQALIPAVAFDAAGQRLGYGKGYYDRALAAMPPTVETIGIGYQMQLISDALPSEPHDKPVHRLCLL